MDLKEYSALALRTANDLGSFDKNLTHAVLGMVDEAGEIAGAFKKYFAYGKDLDLTNLKEELGDLAWFMNLAIDTLNLTWEDVLETNIRKLEARYPDLRFNPDHAINRDKGAETAAMTFGEYASDSFTLPVDQERVFGDGPLANDAVETKAALRACLVKPTSETGGM